MGRFLDLGQQACEVLLFGVDYAQTFARKRPHDEPDIARRVVSTSALHGRARSG
jgi:hypothetical protein